MIDLEKIVLGIRTAKEAWGYQLRSCTGSITPVYNDVHEVVGYCGCALSLAAVGTGVMTLEEGLERKTTAYMLAAARLGMTEDERTGFVVGFDRRVEDDRNYKPSDMEDKNGFVFGREMRKMFCPLDPYRPNEYT